jgi:tetratricopeptide (TPR) repeat protein
LHALEELTAASNAVIDLVHAGKLDEAERAARELLVRFPEMHDGYDRLGMVYQARGDNKQAVNYCRQGIDFVRARPDQYEPVFETTFQRLIQKLDPPTTD